LGTIAKRIVGGRGGEVSVVVGMGGGRRWGWWEELGCWQGMSCAVKVGSGGRGEKVRVRVRLVVGMKLVVRFRGWVRGGTDYFTCVFVYFPSLVPFKFV
jgi:hypothetical protein